MNEQASESERAPLFSELLFRQKAEAELVAALRAAESRMSGWVFESITINHDGERVGVTVASRRNGQPIGQDLTGAETYRLRSTLSKTLARLEAQTGRALEDRKSMVRLAGGVLGWVNISFAQRTRQQARAMSD